MKITFNISIGNEKCFGSMRRGAELHKIIKVKLGRRNQNHIIRLMAVIKFINFTCNVYLNRTVVSPTAEVSQAGIIAAETEP